MIVLPALFLLALLGATEDPRERAALENELQNRLGLRGRGGEPRGTAARFAWIDRTFGPDALAYVKIWLREAGFSPDEEQERLNPLLPLLARTVQNLPRRNLLFPNLPSFDYTRVLHDFFTRSGLPSDGDLGEVADYIRAVHPDVSAADWKDLVAQSKAWHDSLPGVTGRVRPGKVVQELDDEGLTGWTIQQLVARKQFEDEGNALRHCLYRSGYFQDFVNKKATFYSIRDDNGEPLFTWEIQLEAGVPIRIVQVKGLKNQTPSQWWHEHRFESDSQNIAEAIVGFSREQVPNLSRWGSDLQGILVAGGSDDLLAEAVRDQPGLFDGDKDLARDLIDRMGESYDRKIVDAWTDAAEKGHVSTYPAEIAFGLMHRAEAAKDWPASFQSIETRLGDYSRGGEEDDFPPWFWLENRVYTTDGPITADLTLFPGRTVAAPLLEVRILGIFRFRCSDGRTDGHFEFWGAAAARYRHGDLHAETENWSKVESFDPAWLYQDQRYEKQNWHSLDVRLLREWMVRNPNLPLVRRGDKSNTQLDWPKLEEWNDSIEPKNLNEFFKEKSTLTIERCTMNF